MSEKVTYLLDSNILIEAKNRYYAFSICQGFWDSLKGHHKTESIYSIDHVKEELLRGDDELTDWVKKLPSQFFLSTQEDKVKEAFHEIMTWVQKNIQFHDTARSSFATEADGWLVAYAKVHRYIVVTHEQLRPDVKNRIPLPNVCRQFKVAYQDIFAMLQKLKIKFVWNKT